MEGRGNFSCAISQSGVGIKMSKAKDTNNAIGRQESTEGSHANNGYLKVPQRRISEATTRTASSTYFWSNPSAERASGHVIGPGGLAESERVLACKSVKKVKADGARQGLTEAEIEELLCRRRRCRRRFV